MVMNQDDERRDGFRFAGGHPALDLAATLGARLKAEPVERLARPEDLARWLVAARLTTLAPAVTPRTLTAARRLREAVYGLAMAALRGERLPDPEVAALNAAARGPAAVPVLDADGGVVLEGSADGLLALVAREAVTLLGDAEGPPIRQCEGDGCAILFVDRSRSGRRRWCSMSACGNRAKATAFRRRDRPA
jgi:predicted RNA-binding Zn ribbon-like protein